MLLGWPLTILLILAIIAIVFFYMRADRDYQQRKLDIVQKRLAALEEKQHDENADQDEKAETSDSDTPRPDDKP